MMSYLLMFVGTVLLNADELTSKVIGVPDGIMVRSSSDATV